MLGGADGGGDRRIVSDSAGGSVSGQRAARHLATAILAGALLGLPGLVPAVQASEFDHRDRDRDCHRVETRHGHERVCFDRGGDRRDGQRFDRGNRSRWERIHHDDFGDCFRTPWGLACETSRLGVYRVRDRHRGDEPGPDCDILFVDEWGWRCVDLPTR
jgi:hypothetical protein